MARAALPIFSPSCGRTRTKIGGIFTCAPPRQSFDREKLERSVTIACRKRPIEPAKIERLVSGIQRQLETSGESEVSASTIGELVMEGLKGLDGVAYIRFASVYRDFTEPREFEEFAGSIAEAARKE